MDEILLSNAMVNAGAKSDFTAEGQVSLNWEHILPTALGSAVARRRWVLWAFAPGTDRRVAEEWTAVVLTRARARGAAVGGRGDRAD